MLLLLLRHSDFNDFQTYLHVMKVMMRVGIGRRALTWSLSAFQVTLFFYRFHIYFSKSWKIHNTRRRPMRNVCMVIWKWRSDDDWKVQCEKIHENKNSQSLQRCVLFFFLQMKMKFIIGVSWVSISVWGCVWRSARCKRINVNAAMVPIRLWKTTKSF